MCESWGDLDARTTWVVSITHTSLHGFAAHLLRAGLSHEGTALWVEEIAAGDLTPKYFPCSSAYSI